jgi:hypothetical protein
LSFDSTVKIIRQRIIEEEKLPQSNPRSVFKAYQLVHDNAIKTMPNDNGMKTEDG